MENSHIMSLFNEWILWAACFFFSLALTLILSRFWSCFLFDYAFTYPVIQFDGFVAFHVCSSQLERNEITNVKPHSHCYYNCIYCKSPPTHTICVAATMAESNVSKFSAIHFLFFNFSFSTTMSFINMYVWLVLLLQQQQHQFRLWQKYSQENSCHRWWWPIEYLR